MRFVSHSVALLVVALLASGLAVAKDKGGMNENKHGNGKSGVCSQTANLLKAACASQTSDDFLVESAKCLNVPAAERAACRSAAHDAQSEAQDNCDAVKAARRELCDAIGEAAYDPPFGADFAANFVDPRDIGGAVTPNPFFPLRAGNRWVYRSETTDDQGQPVTQIVTVVVTDKTKLIDGIQCVVVSDRAENDGSLVEDTLDWYAQDLQGNVWYCGESSQSLSSFDGDSPVEPELVSIDGSWKAGRDGAKPGIVMPGNPAVGNTFRQELAWGDAEDASEVSSLTGTETSPAASCNGHCLVTRDFSPLDAGSGEEHKFWLANVGQILTIDLDTGEREELTEFDPGP